MTFREKLKSESPEDVSSDFIAGCYGCPYDYGYESEKGSPCYGRTGTFDEEECTKCWDREIPSAEPTKPTDEEHDGCTECKHYELEELDYPCSDCKGTAVPGTQEHYRRDDLFKPKEVEPVDMVNAPPHYTNGIECIDEMIAVFGNEVVADFCLCNVWKYRKRALHKNGQEDLDKADWYMKKFMELEGKLPTDPMVKLP